MGQGGDKGPEGLPSQAWRWSPGLSRPHARARGKGSRLRYLSDVFKGELPPRQAGRADGRLAHGQARRAGELLSSARQLGGLSGLDVDPAETRPGSGTYP